MDVNCRCSLSWRGYVTHCFTHFLRTITASVILCPESKKPLIVICVYCVSRICWRGCNYHWVVTGQTAWMHNMAPMAFDTWQFFRYLLCVPMKHTAVCHTKYHSKPFYLRNAMLARVCDSDVSVHLSGRLSVTLRYCAYQSESRIVKCTPSDSPMILVSDKVWVVEKFARGHPKGTCQMRVGWVFSAIFDQYVVISRKRCILNTKLLWDGNRKPYASYRMVSLSMTLSDPWPGFQGQGECSIHGGSTSSYMW